MSTRVRQAFQSAAGAAGGAALNVEDVFSTYLYTGTEASSQTITNNIDLSGEGGLVWVKARDSAINHILMDTEQGVGKFLNSNQTYAQQTDSEGIKSFNTDGFTFGTQTGVGWSNDHVYWTFRKAPKFFDVVQFTGDGAASKTISHNLGATPACIFVKVTSGASDWKVYHSSVGNTGALYLNTTDATITSSLFWNNTSPTNTEFTVGGANNGNGATYVAYLFAHNDGDGDFGPTGDQDIIKCGSYTGTTEVNLGFEPQFILRKRIDSTGNWALQDTMRGWGPFIPNNYEFNYLLANTGDAESTSWGQTPTSTGFTNAAAGTYIYIAIRRGPMAVPESATDVFTVGYNTTSQSDPGFSSGSVGVVDLAMRWYDVPNYGDSYTARWFTRLTGTKQLTSTSTAAETDNNGNLWDYMDGVSSSGAANFYYYLWKRAPSFFDVVTYTGNGVAGRTVSHNLGVAPEMMWVKRRNSANMWAVYHKDLGNTDYIQLQSDAASGTLSVFWNNTSPTSTDFTVGTYTAVNGNADTFIAYLFASLDGISKVGSYTGNGSTQTINCGFSSGARFILIKRTDSTGDWYVWDTERGIVAANDPHLSLNTTAAEVTTDDSVDPVSSGFAVNQVAATNINVSSASYIYYAVS